MNQQNRYVQRIVQHFNAKLAEHNIEYVLLDTVNDLNPGRRMFATRDRHRYIQDYSVPSEYSPNQVVISFSLVYDLSQLPDSGRKRIRLKGVDNVDGLRLTNGLLDTLVIAGELDVLHEKGRGGSLFQLNFTGQRVTTVRMAKARGKFLDPFKPRLTALRAEGADVRDAIDLAFEMYASQ